MISYAYAQGVAHAQAGGGVGGTDMMAFLPMIAIFVLFYFLLIRPQQKRAKEHRAMLGALQKGDEVETAGGIVGRVTRISDNYVGLEIADKIEVNLQRTAIAKLLPKGTLKTL